MSTALATPPPAPAAPAGDAVPGRSLPDLCAGLFAYVLWLRDLKDEKVPELRAVNQRFDELLREFDVQGQRSGASPEHVRLVLFAMVAFADEMILNSKLPFRAAWADQPLQLTYFNENAAGEEFFTRLEAARRPGGAAADVLESFYLCLSLGFKGRFGGSPKLEKQRRSFMERLAADIGAVRSVAGGLSPHIAVATGVRPQGRLVSVWLAPLFAVFAVLVALIVYNLLVNNLADDALTAFVS